MKNSNDQREKPRNGMRARVDRNMTMSTARGTKGGKRKWRDEKKFQTDGRTDGRTDESECK